MRLRDLLHKLRWDPHEDFDGATITYVDRVKDGRRTTLVRHNTLKGSDVTEVSGGYLTTNRGGEVSHIPLHRVRGVSSSDGRLRWSDGKG
jgi:uncharacterized protein (UPF0248 family)